MSTKADSRKSKNLVKEARIRYGLSQSGFARLVGLQKHQIKNFEHRPIRLSADAAYKVFLATGLNDNLLRRGDLVSEYGVTTAAAWADRLRAKTRAISDFEAIAKKLFRHTLAAIKDPGYPIPSHRALLIYEVCQMLSRFREQTRCTQKGSTRPMSDRRKRRDDDLPYWTVEYAAALTGADRPNLAAVREDLGLPNQRKVRKTVAAEELWSQIHSSPKVTASLLSALGNIGRGE